MPEVTLRKLPAGNSLGPNAITRRPIRPAEEQPWVGDGHDPAIADVGACDLDAQIFEGGGAAASGLHVLAPVHPPNLRVHFSTGVPKVMADCVFASRSAAADL